MAKQIITTLIDDTDGSEADETLRFSLDGIAYEIDLSGKNAKRLRDFLEPFMDAGTSVGRVGGPAQLQRSRPTVTSTANREENNRIRDWANENGFDVAARGRIPADVYKEYQRVTRRGREMRDAQTVVAAVKNGSRELSFRP